MAGSKSLRGLIALIASAGGRVETRIRIQKEAFLLAASNVGEFKASSFSYHHYGPYSREISDTLQFAVSSGLVIEHKEHGAGDGLKYSYTLPQEGRDFLKEAGEPDENENHFVNLMNGYHWRALELAATVRFLEMRRDSEDHSDAMLKALELKPDTKNYQGEARALLEILQKDRLVQV